MFQKRIFSYFRAKIIILSGVFLQVLTMKLAKPIQIIKKKNHLFHLNLNEIEAILASGELIDRHVSIVSIAGDLREGKSFLLGFFIKYLNARVKITFIHKQSPLKLK